MKILVGIRQAIDVKHIGTRPQSITSSGMRGQSSIRRVNGLDTLRATAITLVFMYHYMCFVSFQPTFGWLSEIGWVGVDLFFVLSGYLIANQILSGVACGQPLSIRSFYARRALRTLPAFWVVLGFYFLFPSMMGGRTPPPFWRFATFTQNFDLHTGTAFSHAWSLCVEEQFYLVLPLLIVIWVRSGRRPVLAWAFLGAGVLMGVSTRAALWTTYGREAGGHIAGYYPHIYYSTGCRVDEFLPGVAVAVLKHFHRSRWTRLMENGQRVLAVGLLATVGVLILLYYNFKIDGYGYGFFSTAAGYSLLAMAFAVLVVAAISPGSWLHGIRVPGAYHVALWSYSLYLSHKALATIVKQLLPAAIPAAALALTASVVCLCGGALLYYLIEAPFMAVRNRLFPTNFPADIRQDNEIAASEPQRAQA